MPDTVPKPAPAATLDRQLHAWQSRFTGGRPPSMTTMAGLDWAVHAINAPFGLAEQIMASATQWQRLTQAATSGAPVIAAAPDDRRFADPAWQRPPYAMMAQAVLLGEEWWRDLVAAPPGVDPGNRRILAFSIQQVLDVASPSNVAWLNPQVVAATRDSGGANLARGLQNLTKARAARPSPEFKVGVDVAATPGQVVFRNSLIELIQYAPTTETVGAEPLLIVPAWIMKYYILDLSPHNSLIGWLVAQGRTVFVISWRNPGAELRDTTLDDYRSLGVMAALDAICAICGEAKIHATGYCLGGTLLAMAAAAMARDGDARLASLSLLASQTDFTEAGDLKLFITEGQLDFLADVMCVQGFLSSEQMGAAFIMLRENQLAFAPAIKAYLLGEEDRPNDLMSWDADGTRLPASMHIEYLRRMYLNNDLAQGHFAVAGRPVALIDMQLPLFVVGTERDTVAPWTSVFKLHLLNGQALTFVLTSGGHNAGIVSEPEHRNRHFRMRTREPGARTLGAVEWEQTTPPQNGSWWPELAAWLTRHSTENAVPPPPMGTAICAEPGTYVLEA